MKANAVPLLAVFEKKLRLEVPLFQRQYVWNREQQWEPLWEDVARKFTEYLEGRKDAPVHFLGALVLDQRQTPTTHVERRQVIDGQQRLTTLQLFLAAFRDFARGHDCGALAGECDAYLLNRGMMADPAADKFKVWPTQLDRPQFRDVVTAGSRATLEALHPLVRRKWARGPDPRPRMVEAYLYFAGQLDAFFLGAKGEPPVAADAPLAARLDECLQALKSVLQVVVIDLDPDDDAQVIFETLNGRGEPLLPADLLRNYIFLRAGRAGESQEALYDEFWRTFDDPFWREEVRQGRLSRPRSDLFLQHFLASRQTIDIPVTHLFVEYKFWIDRQRPFASVREELATLARQGADFRRITAPKRGDVVHPLVAFLDTFDVRTVYPLLLHLFDAGLPDAEWRAVARGLESYLFRRALGGLTTKNYNRVFLQLTRALRAGGTSGAQVVGHLARLKGESTEWPDDARFRDAWLTTHAYRTLSNPKLVHLFTRLNATFLSSKTESVVVEGPLSVEHTLPQDWVAHWPLPDGTPGLRVSELYGASADDPRAVASYARHATLQTLGNLTIVTQPLNASLSNAAWPTKRAAIAAASLLPINQQLCTAQVWDEKAIESRARDLFTRALTIWPAPGAWTT